MRWIYFLALAVLFSTADTEFFISMAGCLACGNTGIQVYKKCHSHLPPVVKSSAMECCKKEFGTNNAGHIASEICYNKYKAASIFRCVHVEVRKNLTTRVQRNKIAAFFQCFYGARINTCKCLYMNGRYKDFRDDFLSSSSAFAPYLYRFNETFYAYMLRRWFPYVKKMDWHTKYQHAECMSERMLLPELGSASIY